MAAEKLVRSARILVCECDDSARPAIGDEIRGLGYEVVANHTLADALREAHGATFDVLVTSIPAVEEGRLKMLQLLRRALPHTPLVIVTSDGSLAMRTRCQPTRPYYFAVRPLAAGELRTAISGALARPAARG
jgi:DNA-binding NtrC family response regulator